MMGKENSGRGIKIITPEDFLKFLEKGRKEYQNQYFAMYSSIWDGIVTDPVLMLVPIDDHMVHRGDAVFEAFKCVEGNLYNVHRHLERLEYSASRVAIELPFATDEILRIVKGTIRVTSHKDCLVRLFVSRGPGGFTTDPYECSRSQLYVVITSLNYPPEEKYRKGVRVKVSSVPAKPGFFANIKSCNYLPNVLMKKEAVDSGVDFTICLDEKGNLGESTTENFGIVSGDGALKFPKFDRILRGTTVVRASELAEYLVERGIIRKVEFCNISVEEAMNAREIMMFGTTFDILPVVEFDGSKIGSGKPGQIFRELFRLLVDDIHNNRNFLEPVF